MDRKTANPNIGCNVTQCRYHCGDKKYCSLEGINVSKQNATAKNKRETICDSFELRNDTELF